MTISSNSLPSSRPTVLDSNQNVKKNTHRSRLIDSISSIINTIASCFKKKNSSPVESEKSKFYISLNDHGKDDLLDANYLLRMNISKLQEEISLYDREIFSEGNKKNLFPIFQTHAYLKSRIKNSLEIKDIHKQNIEFEDIMKVQCQVISDSIKKLNDIKSTEAKVFGKKPINTKEFIQNITNKINESQDKLGTISLKDELNSKVKSVPDSHQNDEFEFDEGFEWDYELNELQYLAPKKLTNLPNDFPVITPYLLEGNLDNQSIINSIDFIETLNQWDNDLHPNNGNLKTNSNESENNKIITQLKDKLKLQQELTERLQNDKDDLQDKINENKEGLNLLKKIIIADTKIIKSAQMQEKIISKGNESIDDLNDSNETKENLSEIMSSEKPESQKTDSDIKLNKSKRKLTSFNHSEKTKRLHKGVPTSDISHIQRSSNRPEIKETRTSELRKAIIQADK
ncbi:TPA: hypothetical protein ACS72K_003265 [Providencia alcalifaciens]